MKNYIFILLIAFSITSCYEDKGNYSYSETNEVKVVLNPTYISSSFKETVEIEPKVTQTIRKDNKNLSYLWVQKLNDYDNTFTDTLSNEINLTIEVDRDADGDKFEFVKLLRLIVTDSETGLQYNTDTDFKVARPYYNCWTILHKKDGKTMLGTVEYQDGKIITKEDAFFQETGKNLLGEPVALACFEHFASLYYKFDEYNNAVRNGYAIMTSTPAESGIYCQWEKFNHKDNFGSMVYAPHSDDFNPANVTYLDGSGSGNVSFISNGQLYQSYVAGKFYKARMGEITGDVNITRKSVESYAILMWDDAGKRFISYMPADWFENEDQFDNKKFSEIEENSELRPIPEHKDNNEDVDPNNITIGQEMLHIGHGYGQDNYSGLTYAIGMNGSNIFVYEFDAYGDAMLYGEKCFYDYHVNSIPKNMTVDSKIETSRGYNGIFFYTSGNSVYRYDFITESSAKIYTHIDQGEITNFKFAKRQYTFLGNDEIVGDNHPNWQKLGLTVEKTDGTSDFIVLHLDITGKVSSDSRYPSKQVYEGFGKVKDIEFL